MSYLCVECNNTFNGGPHCVSCGAGKLYDSTFHSLMERVGRQNNRILRLEEKIIQATRHLERAGFFTEADEVYGVIKQYK